MNIFTGSLKGPTPPLVMAAILTVHVALWTWTEIWARLPFWPTSSDSSFWGQKRKEREWNTEAPGARHLLAHSSLLREVVPPTSHGAVAVFPPQAFLTQATANRTKRGAGTQNGAAAASGPGPTKAMRAWHLEWSAKKPLEERST